LRDKVGYSDDWYDALDMDEEYHTYFFTPPANTGDLYITVQTYTENLIQPECADGVSEIPMPEIGGARS